METYDYVSSSYFRYVKYDGDNSDALEELAGRSDFDDFYGLDFDSEAAVLRLGSGEYEVPIGHYLVLDTCASSDRLRVYDDYDFHEKFKPEYYYSKLWQGILDETPLVSGEGYLDTCVRVSAVRYDGYNFSEIRGLLPDDMPYYYRQDDKRTLTLSSRGYHYEIPVGHFCVYSDSEFKIYDPERFDMLYADVNYYGNLLRAIKDPSMV